MMKPHEPQPYATMNVDQYLFNVRVKQQKYHLNAACFDRRHGFLYVLEYMADNNKGLVHVWKVKSSSDPYEPNNTRSQAYEVSFSGTPPTWLSALGSGIDQKRDQDWFKFTALRGDKLTIVCDVTSMLNAKLALYYKKKLRQVANSARAGGDETLVYKCRSSGTFYVKIGFGRGRSGKAPIQASAGSYRLKIVKE